MPYRPTMSLKAKIEAVIYAAEEPVTLAQLAAIFAAEVPAPEIPASPDPAESLPLQLETPVAEAFENPDGGASSKAHEITSLDESGTMTSVTVDSEGAEASRLESETTDVASPLPVTWDGKAIDEGSATAATTPSLEDLDVATRRATRQREREVREHIRTLVDELIAEYLAQDRGIEIREIAGGYRMATKPEYHDALRAFVKSMKPVMKLSLQALETLAVIAYKQPVTAPEVAEIRGVDSGGVLASLISRKLVTTAGRKQVIGRPILYKTTKEFLLRFGLKDVSELPSMEEFEKMAVELAESDAMEADAMHEKAGVPAAQESDSEEQPTLEAGTPTAAAEITHDEKPGAGMDATAQQSANNNGSHMAAQHEMHAGRSVEEDVSQEQES